ncbi:MAG: crossover junction endodeoxyribonuclease RuvC [Candidatus Berkelbacteria bacterium Licking1014_85]|uniref:Crossover junction endodeoxyribonuclease RuvC n=1 Tax=Candidatus Berkelbacteria bacterium Licking1014_85 TaxID=2017148 RepID=A0A554LI99_9BACT|nr:MAG: crossover junction endodeoxyribonuclease RuvC [Candidatus Berkelbacteria bacterium Licking1014_85]
MKILGIDPGTTRCGWGIIEIQNPKPARHRYAQAIAGGCQMLNFGIFENGKEVLVGDRLRELHLQIDALIKKEQPDEMAIEEIFFMNNIKTAISVAQARGVLIAVAKLNNIPVFEYKPTEIKIALTGYGHADKTQMQKMVKLLLKLDEIPQPDDVADALAVAICHSQSRKLY